MSKKKLPSINFDGESISAAMRSMVDYMRYRRYAKEGFTTVIEINSENNTVRMRDGILKDSLLTVRGTENEYLINKIYMLPTKKLVTKCVFIAEGSPSTLDLQVPTDARQAKILLNKFAQIKLLDEFNSFNMGQVLLGLLGGIILGSLGLIALQMIGGLVVG
jgi:hypothetical protein